MNKYAAGNNIAVDELITKLAGIAKANVQIAEDNFFGIRFRFSRPGLDKDVRGSYEPDALNEAIANPSGSSAQALIGMANEAKSRLDRFEQDKIDGKIRYSREAKNGRPFTLSDGTTVFMSDLDMDGNAKTSAERFDDIKATIAEINLEIARSFAGPLVCQIYAAVKQTSGDNLSIVSDEEWIADKFIYTQVANINDVVVVMKAAPDANGECSGEEVMLTASDLVDCFPDLYEKIDSQCVKQGYGGFRGFSNSIKKLIAGRRDFGRALAEMSHSTLASAREEAAKIIETERDSFYKSAKGFGQF